MTSITSVSQEELSQRRQQLRRQRRIKNLQSIWRTIAVTGLAAGVTWVITLPGWVIRRPEQVTIDGNKLLSTRSIQTLLPLSYPQSLLQLQPQQLARSLEAKALIAEARVTRQLFPPRLIIQVKERHPVAVATPVPTTNSKTLEAKDVKSSDAAQVGLLDVNGNWIPLKTYTALGQALKLPKLRIIGDRDHYRPHWSELYQTVSRSPVKISELDWRDPTNITVKTEVGTFYIGPYTAKFSHQLKAIDRMRKLPNRLNIRQIDYIDITNPDLPSIHLAQAKSEVTSDTP